MSEKLITIPEMKEILPCRNSLLLLDRACMVGENKIIGLKCVTQNELHFIGHFPGHPIMPGVLVVESIAQLGELAVWQRLNPDRKLDLYVKSLRRVKFRRPNNPGDRLIIEIEVTKITDDGADLTAVVRNNGGVSCQAEMTLGVREKDWSVAVPTGFNEFDKAETSAMDVTKIMSFIPHRFPFLFVDYVSHLGEDGHVTAVKNVTNTEYIFRTYSDGYQVLMGSVQPEIVAQAGCIFMLSNPATRGKIAYFMGIDEATFRTTPSGSGRDTAP